MDREEELELRIKKLENQVEALAHLLSLALKYVDQDPKSSLTKSRIDLEKIVHNVYKIEMKEEPKKIELGGMLNNNQFTKRIEKRIVSRMNSIRDMANLGPHDDDVVENKDAMRVLTDIVEVVDWYLERYGALSLKKNSERGKEDIYKTVTSDNINEILEDTFNISSFLNEPLVQNIMKYKNYKNIIGDHYNSMQKLAQDFWTEIEALKKEKEVFKIAVTGGFSVGKTALINTLAFEGSFILQQSVEAMAGIVTSISYSEEIKAEVEFYSREELDRLIACKSLPDKFKDMNTKYEKLLGEKKFFKGYKNQEELIDRFKEYIGLDGKFMPFVKKINIYNNNPILKGIEIIDVPSIYISDDKGKALNYNNVREAVGQVKMLLYLNDVFSDIRLEAICKVLEMTWLTGDFKLQMIFTKCDAINIEDIKMHIENIDDYLRKAINEKEKNGIFREEESLLDGIKYSLPVIPISVLKDCVDLSIGPIKKKIAEYKDKTALTYAEETDNINLKFIEKFVYELRLIGDYIENTQCGTEKYDNYGIKKELELNSDKYRELKDLICSHLSVYSKFI